MFRKVFSIAVVASFLLVLGCATHIHKVGNGPQSGVMVEQRQWYVLFGLVPINEVDTHAIAGDASDYEIKTQMTFVDGVISAFTQLVSVYPRTVTVTK